MSDMHKQLFIGVALMILGTLVSILTDNFIVGVLFGWILALGILMIIGGYLAIAGASMFPPVTD